MPPVDEISGFLQAYAETRFQTFSTMTVQDLNTESDEFCQVPDTYAAIFGRTYRGRQPVVG